MLSFAVLLGAEQQPVASALITKPPWASTMGRDQYGTWADLVVKGGTQRCRHIPAGTFTMGCDDAETDAVWNEAKQKFPKAEYKRTTFEAHQHTVTLTQGFWMADSACTQALWQAITGSNPSQFTGDPQRPVEHVSWDNCQEFCTTLTAEIPGALARLPTEAEWEYACRAGTTGLYNDPDIDAVAWFSGNSGNTTHPVKQKAANTWGLYDMRGNVWQWCADWHGDFPAGAVTDPTGTASGSNRVYRGSGWGSASATCRSEYRGRVSPGLRLNSLGFRLCISAQSDKSP
jgi:formylglycine-generating enzyme required for sulfatase activity